MKKDMTELVFILDKSGSMAGLERDTVGGFNAMFRKQKPWTGSAGSPQCSLTTVTSCSTTASTAQKCIITGRSRFRRRRAGVETRSPVSTPEYEQEQEELESAIAQEQVHLISASLKVYAVTVQKS